jgi:hypothetical protein
VEQSAAVVLTLRSELEPDVGKVPDGWTVAGTLRAAEGVVAGDCYDLFVTRQGDIALIVVDIAGHGATEGILALRCKEVLRTLLMSGAEPGDALETTAELLGDMGVEVFSLRSSRDRHHRRPCTVCERRPSAGDRGERRQHHGASGPLVRSSVACWRDGRRPRRSSRRATTSAPTPTGSPRPATATTSSSAPTVSSSCCRVSL